MGKTFRNFKDLERAIQKDVQDVMSEAESKSINHIEKSKKYKDINFKSTGVKGLKNHYEYGITASYLDEMENINILLDDMKKDVKNIADSVFDKKFKKID